jgi:hypothetical protein
MSEEAEQKIARDAGDQQEQQQKPTKVPCLKCGSPILPATAERTGGICMKCHKGQQKPKSLGGAVSAGAFVGAVAGLASHCFAGNKMTFPIFLIAYILIFSGFKGLAKLVGLIVLTVVAALIVAVFQYLEL